MLKNHVRQPQAAHVRRFYLDARLKTEVTLPASAGVVWISPNLISRFAAEFHLASNHTEADVVVCFHSLPPLLKMKSKVKIFIQNRLLLENLANMGFPIMTRLKFAIKKVQLTRCLKSDYILVVQTRQWQNALAKN